LIRCRSYYNARYYDAPLNRFIQPDSIIPDFYNPQYLNRYSYVQNNPVRYTDPTGHWTFGFGFGFTIGAGAGFSGSIMVVFDWHGNGGFAVSGGGGGYAGIGGSGGIIVQGTNADNIDDLNGAVAQTGGSGGPPGVSVGAELVTQKSKDGPVTGLNINVGPGIQGNGVTPFETHGIVEDTLIVPIPSPEELNDYYQDDPVVLWP